MKNEEKPIGYWLKKIDSLLTQQIDKVHNNKGINRKGWQILNTIMHKEKIERTDLKELIRPLMTELEMNEILNNLKDKKYLNGLETLSLTPEGISFFKELSEIQQKIRMQTMNGISFDEYEIMMNTLKKIAKNLEE